MTQAPPSEHVLLLLSPNLDGRLPPSRPRQHDDALAPAPPVDAPLPSEPLTWEQICARYPREWVCLVEMEDITGNNLAFRTARVVGHGRTRRACLDQARPALEHHKTFGHLFTGIR